MTGIAVMLTGLVVLVFTAVGLSLVIDGHIDNSRRQSELRQSVSREGATLQSLAGQLRARTELVNAQVVEHEQCEAEYQSIVSRVTLAKAKWEQLLATKTRTAETLGTLAGQFESYRNSYRQQTRQDAAGETHRTIKLLSGRVFDNVVIKRVTDVGLEVSHQAGIARIDAKDLDDSWHQRFQWDQTRRRATLDKENQELQAGSAAAPEAASQSISADSPDSPAQTWPGTYQYLLNQSIHGAAPKSAQTIQPSTRNGQSVQDLERMRAAVMFWKGKISALQSECHEANINRSYGRSRSVPGSLESWDAKAVRVKAELVRARTSLQLAAARLAAASPNDPCLFPHDSNGP